MLALQALSAWDVVNRAAEGPCICDGAWLPRTMELLDIQCAAYPPMAPPVERPSHEAIRSAIVTALRNGCGKHTNVFIYGPNTSGKSHILKPLTEVFADCCFVRPAGKGNYPLEKLFGAKVCVLQDVRTHTFKLAWDDLLVWFEGERFTVPLPRNRHGGEGRLRAGPDLRLDGCQVHHSPPGGAATWGPSAGAKWDDGCAFSFLPFSPQLDGVREARDPGLQAVLCGVAPLHLIIRELF